MESSDKNLANFSQKLTQKALELDADNNYNKNLPENTATTGSTTKRYLRTIKLDFLPNTSHGSALKSNTQDSSKKLPQLKPIDLAAISALAECGRTNKEPQQNSRANPSARKELFKAPQQPKKKTPSNNKGRESFYSRKSITVKTARRSSITKHITTSNKRAKPSINILEATLLVESDDNSNNKENLNTPPSDDEFAILEKQLQIQDYKTNIPSFCQELKQVINQLQLDHEKELQMLKSAHEKRIKYLTDMLAKFKSISLNNTPKSALKEQKKNTQDLRRELLKKVATASSPNTNNAVNLYNSIRSDCRILCTPVVDRAAATPSVSSKKLLSRKIQSQCLLLQDTPKKI